MAYQRCAATHVNADCDSFTSHGLPTDPRTATEAGGVNRGARLTGAVLIALLLAACRSTESGGGPAVNDAPEGPVTARVGSPILVEGLRITVVEASYSRGFEFQEPAAGHIYVAYEIKAEAVDGDQLVSSSDFSVSSDGSEQGRSTIVVTDQWEPLLTFEDLRAGRSIGGWIVFEVPDPDAYVELAFETDPFAAGPAFVLRTNCCD